MELSKNFEAIKVCRACNSRLLKNTFNLGLQSFTGIFPVSKNQKVPSGPLHLITCKKCQLIQLKHNFNRSKMFGKNYGYESGLNQSMKRHLKNVLNYTLKFVSISNSDPVVDIGSNDGTLLNCFGKNKKNLYGIDPTINKKFKNLYNKNINCISKLFDNIAVDFLKNKIKKAKIVFSISMFYDLPNPVKFAKNIKELIRDDGIWVSEQSYCPFMLKNNSFDTICHEHLEYYTIKSIKHIFNQSDLKIIDISFNDINGGSFRITAASKKSKLKEFKKLKLYEKQERELLKKYNFSRFFKNINQIENKLKSFLIKKKNSKEVVYGYGASTKGNVLLQHFKINSKLLPFISEVNKFKFNRYTPLTKIKILNQKIINKNLPNYFLVLPWHFKKHILKKDISLLKKGVKYIFPLPDLKVYSYRKSKIISNYL